MSFQEGYRECKQAADDQVCNILRVKNREDIPANEDVGIVLSIVKYFGLISFVLNEEVLLIVVTKKNEMKCF